MKSPLCQCTKVLNNIALQRQAMLLLHLESLYGTTDPIPSLSHTVVEQQLLIPGFLPKFLETKIYLTKVDLEKVATAGI